MKSKKPENLNRVLLFVVCCLLFVSPALAQFRLETGLPGVPGGQLTTGKELPEYINYLFIFGLGSIGILALGVMMFGGIQYILAAGNAAKTEDAKEWIKSALYGLALLFASYLILRTINPDLVNLRNPNLKPVNLQVPNPGPPSRDSTSCSPSDPAPSCFICQGGIWIRTCNPNL